MKLIMATLKIKGVKTTTMEDNIGRVDNLDIAKENIEWMKSLNIVSETP